MEVNKPSTSSIIKQSSEDDDSLSVSYYFESEALATHENYDYRNLLSTITLLEGQRSRALDDIQRLIEMQRAALADPIAFVDNLQRRCPMDSDDVRPQRVAELPTIDWHRYAVNVDPATSTSDKHHRTRNKGVARDDDLSASSSTSSILAEADSEGIGVRGRIKLDGAPELGTFNQLWTSEEQKRLERLLQEYPAEEVEARRWAKIARALGNRTTQQVASRVQKYFIKLAKTGLPVPGRVPNVGQYNKKGFHRHQRYNKFYFQSSTFLTSYEPPVFMSDDDEDDDSMSHTSSTRYDAPSDGQQREYSDIVVSDEEDIPAEMRDTAEYREIIQLKRLRKEKMLAASSTSTQHVGYKCDRCQCDPIIGTRWHCRDCPPEESIDFCDECIDLSCDVGCHNSSHRLDAVRHVAGRSTSEPSGDRDYMLCMPGGYNYLDPNYVPTTS